MPPTLKACAPLSYPMAPTMTPVTRFTRELADVFTFDLAPESAAPFTPGQFNMLYAFGVGEIPISISGDSQCARAADPYDPRGRAGERGARQAEGRRSSGLARSLRRRLAGRGSQRLRCPADRRRHRSRAASAGDLLAAAPSRSLRPRRRSLWRAHAGRPHLCQRTRGMAEDARLPVAGRGGARRTRVDWGRRLCDASCFPSSATIRPTRSP